jgi:hypothetical protein
MKWGVKSHINVNRLEAIRSKKGKLPPALSLWLLVAETQIK